MSKLYEIRESPGKGLGCFATQKIKLGTVIFREKLLIKVEKDSRDSRSHEREWKEVWNKFQALNLEDQAKYLSLMNKLSDLPKNGNPYFQVLNKEMTDLLKTMNLDKDDFQKALNVLQISATNSFCFGVGLEISRINHSCGPNAILHDKNAVDTINIRRLTP